MKKTRARERKLYLIIGSLVLLMGLLLVPSMALAVPNAPGYSYAKGISSTEIAVNWKPLDAVDGYYVYRSDTETGTYVKIAQVTGAYNNYFVDKDAYYPTPEIETIGASTEYFYKVSAYDATGESVLSSVIKYTYTNKNGVSQTEILSRGRTMVADPPRGITLTDNHDMTVTIKWNASREPNVTGYNIYRASVSGGTFVKVNSSLITGLEYADNITFYRDYYYVVAAVDAKNIEGKRSAERWIKPEGRPPVEVPHVKFQEDAKECAYCHNSHTASGQDLMTKVSEAEVCYVCHDGTGSQNVTYQEFSGDYPSKHNLGTGGLTCASCHDSHLDYSSTDSTGKRNYPKLMRPVSLDGNMTYKGNALCYKCHGAGSALKGGDHETPFENGIHNVNMPNPTSGTEIKCMTCHEPHASPNKSLTVYKEENSCFVCHYQDKASSSAPDIYERIMASTDADTHHDVFDTDQKAMGSKIECVNCHNPHGVTAQNKNVDPDSPGPNKLWTGSKNDFCLKCHDGTFPTEAQTQPHAPGVSSGSKTLINISEAYSTGSDGAADKHGQADGQPKNFDPDMGYSNATDAPNYVLDCSKCHESHGTVNGYNLRSEVTSLDGTVTKRGLMTFDWYYQDGSVTVRGVDARFFCNACHGIKNMGNNKSFPTDCFSGGTGCHSHKKKF